MKYIVTVNGKNYEVEVEKGQASIISTTEAAIPTSVNVERAITTQPKQNNEEKSAVVSSNINGEPLKAPMPGMILEIKVKKGATVKKGDVLFILEAMKMENEITAPENAIVADITVTKGASVATGDTLAVLK